MSHLKSTLNTASPEFKAQVAFSHSRLAELKAIQTAWQARQDAQNERRPNNTKLSAADRIKAMLDPGSPFLELAPFAAHEVYDEPIPRAGMVAGIGLVHNRLCLIAANDPDVKGGTYYPLTVKKHLRAQQIAEKHHLPCIYLVDSGGANLPHQAEVFPDENHFGKIFYNQAHMSAKGIAQIAVVLGSCTAGGAYIPAMCDQTIIVKEQGTIFLGGPPLVKAATGEIVDAQSLGGADVHTRLSGVADFYAENEWAALSYAREALAFSGRPVPASPQTARPPRYAAEELYGLCTPDNKKPIPAREVIARIVDDSELHEFKQRFGTTIVCGFAKIHGYPVGIIASDGVLFSEAALKATHFISLCDQRRVPIIFLQNISGFMIGKAYENEGIAKHGAKMVTALSNATVPRLTLIFGGSHGAGNYAMCGRAYQPDFLFCWPNARVSVMGGEQAAGVMTDVKRASMKKRDIDWPDNEAEKFKKETQDYYNHQAEALYGSARLWDDGIIDPADSRDILGLSLSVCHNHEWPAPSFSLYRM
jgi:3-methylcrotonyl-CoA carboxylase beta subunit